MKRKDIQALASKSDAEIKLCKVLEHNDSGITFVVDENLTKPTEHLSKDQGIEIAQRLIREKQIDEELFDIVKCSFANNLLSDLGRDVLYRCIVRCFAEHRPLVLSPDVIWLVICQRLTEHITDNAEKFRSRIVYHEGKLDIVVKTPVDIRDEKCDWEGIFNSLFREIESKTKNNIAPRIVADFSTTSIDERLSSIATLMHGVESYFTYTVRHMICGIPNITLKGNKGDWEHLLSKAEILNNFGLSNWHAWLEPILREFVRAASGTPQLDFWRNIVQVFHDDEFTDQRGCSPDDQYIDGWCIALFYNLDYDSRKPVFNKFNTWWNMDSEMLRVGFNYRLELPNGAYAESPMELWSGVVGIEEDETTFALTPKIGWFVRGAHEHEESLGRLKSAKDRYDGISMTIDEVPEILNELDDFGVLRLRFKGAIKLPGWFFEKSIKELSLYGEIDESYADFIKGKFSKVCINEDPYEFDWDEE